MTQKKTRILFIPSSQNGGVYYYRVYTPMKMLSEKHSDIFDITIDGSITFTDEEKEKIGKNYDIVWIHQALYIAHIQNEMWKCIVWCKTQYHTKFILDLDDYFEYHECHPAYQACMFNAFPDKMMLNFRMFDYFTVTTDYFKEVISKWVDKSKIFVLPNAISFDDQQFSFNKEKSDKLRIGLTGGASHTEDIKQLLEMGKHLTDKQLDKIEFVFCGYDTKNAIHYDIGENGEVVGKRKLLDHENWWCVTEDIFKRSFKHYKRIESKSIMNGEFGKIYENIDVLLVPLENNLFNRCKSPLKFIEAAFTGTAVVASKVIPYSNFGTDGQDCLLVKDKDPKSWAQAIKKILREKELYLNIASKNKERCLKEYNLEAITENRKEFLLSVLLQL